MAWEGSTRRSRLPANWPQIREFVLERDGWQCTWRTDGVRCPTHAADVDHIIPIDDHSPDNLRSLCSWHHQIKSSSEGGRARAAKHSTRRPPERHPGLK